LVQWSAQVLWEVVLVWGLGLLPYLWISTSRKTHMFCSHDAPTGVSPLKDSDGKTYSDRETKANILNKQFSSVFSTNEDKSTMPDKGPSPHPTMGPIGASWEQNMCVFRDVEIHKLSLHICFHRSRRIESL
jgi:hypothetical protein